MKIGKTGAAIVDKMQNTVIQGKKYADKVIHKHSADSFLPTDKLNKDKALRHLHSMFVKITPDDVAVIEKADNKDAAVYCYSLVCNSMKIPEEIAPEFIIKPLFKDVPRVSGIYDYMFNMLHSY